MSDDLTTEDIQDVIRKAMRSKRRLYRVANDNKHIIEFRKDGTVKINSITKYLRVE